MATTTGITASMPMSLTLIAAIAGRDKAETDRLAEYRLDALGRASQQRCVPVHARPFALTAIGNTVAFWRRERLGMELTPGVDEVSLALVADASSRTYRSRAVTFSGTPGAQQTRNGIRILPDLVTASWPAKRLLPAIGERQPAKALDETLDGIAARYGMRTADFVALQLEYQRSR